LPGSGRPVLIVKAHLCGIAVAYEDKGTEDKPDDWQQFESDSRGHFFGKDYTFSGRPQGSLYSQQKRAIADAAEYMRLNAKHKAIIFVCTSPGFTDLANERKLIQKFTHNLRNGHDCQNYIWVREATQMGYPHFHFIADMPVFNPVNLSLYWSGLFGVQATNAIRLGTYPGRGKKRQFYLNTKRMSWYLTKYLGKGIGNAEKGANKTAKVRTFAISQELRKLSAPTLFRSKMVRVETGRQVMTITGLKPFTEEQRIFQNCKSFMTEKEVQKKWNWQYTGFNNTWKGFPKEWKIKPKQTTI
jgi:hypothetical protein